jgi:hypothetical protein
MQLNEKIVLREFLGSWLAWAIGDAIDIDQGGKFNRGVGLCSSLEGWIGDRGWDWEEASGVYKLFKNLLEEYNDDPTFPFGGEIVYYREQGDCSMHLNPERIHWVARTIARLEEE